MYRATNYRFGSSLHLMCAKGQSPGSLSVASVVVGVLTSVPSGGRVRSVDTWGKLWWGRPSPDKVCVSLNEYFFSTTSGCQCRLRLFGRQGSLILRRLCVSHLARLWKLITVHSGDYL
jgi:hypothetical protein